MFYCCESSIEFKEILDDKSSVENSKIDYCTGTTWNCISDCSGEK